jgi:ABC-type nitrate/sulfonate/bicarbonate transport system substrate-binding protein
MNNKTIENAEVITIGYNNKVCYETFIIASELGYFDELEVKVNTVIINGGGTDSAAALLSGTLDLAAMGDTPAVQTLNKNNDTAIICRYGYSESMHAFVASKGSGIDPNYLFTLDGKNIGVQKDSSTEGALLDWLRVNGVNKSTITLTYLNPGQQVAALGLGNVDMIASSQPNPQNALKMDGTYKVGDSSGLGNSYPLILIASSNTINQKSEAIIEVISALQKATDYMNQNPEECAAVVANVIGGSWTEDDELVCMKEITWEIEFNENPDIDSLEKTAEVLRNSGQDISEDLNFMNRFDSKYIEGLK